MCPQHSCSLCKRKTGECGGMLYRCMVCPCAYCEDHVPAQRSEMVIDEELEALGYKDRFKAFFILCSLSCFDYYRSNQEQYRAKCAPYIEYAAEKETEINVTANLLANVPEHVCHCTEDDPNEAEGDEEPFCFCQSRKRQAKDFHVCCDICNEWYHGACVGINKEDSTRIRMFVCSKCESFTDTLSVHTQYLDAGQCKQWLPWKYVLLFFCSREPSSFRGFCSFSFVFL